MTNSSRVAVVTAVIAALAALGSAMVSVNGAREIRELEERQAERLEAAEFIGERLTKLYVPVTMHFAATKALFDRFFESTTSAEEKVAIEHELRRHNREVRERLMQWSVFVEPGSTECGQGADPDDLVRDLLEHLVQWETVYRLKYEYKVYKGPVFAGISEFGFRGFPQGVDDYFRCTERALRRQMHERLREASAAPR